MARRQKLNAREVAHRVMDGAFIRRKSMDETLGQLQTRHDLDHFEARDNAFLRSILSHALRRVGEADKIIAEFLKEELRDARLTVQNILRLGTAELIFMEREPYAVVDAYVSLAKTGSRDAQRLSGLVNAVLRRISEREDLTAQSANPLLNTPTWLMDALVRAYGGEVAAHIARAQVEEAPLDLTLKADDAQSQDLIETFLSQEKFGASLLSTGSLRLKHPGPVRDLPGFKDGLWWVQDTAAQLPARLFGDITGKAVLDLCAAPGGKTLQLAAAGAEVTAVDRSTRRLGILAENLDRMSLNADLVEADAATFQPEHGMEPFSFILLDAPCSATGTIRRNPDVPWLREERDIKALTQLQDRLIDHAADILAPDGILIFCTCSLLPQEGESRVQRLLTKRKDFERIPVSASEVGSVTELINQDGDLRTLPQHLLSEGGMDGFYAARLRRNAGSEPQTAQN